MTYFWTNVSCCFRTNPADSCAAVGPSLACVRRKISIFISREYSLFTYNKKWSKISSFFYLLKGMIASCDEFDAYEFVLNRKGVVVPPVGCIVRSSGGAGPGARDPCFGAIRQLLAEWDEGVGVYTAFKSYRRCRHLSAMVRELLNVKLSFSK